MNQAEFRKELVKIMPGYNWTVHRDSSGGSYLVATGIQTAGMNRLSTLQVERRDNCAGGGRPRYEVKSAGYGKKAPWMHTMSDSTLARALRGLQHHYETMAARYGARANDLQSGRAAIDSNVFTVQGGAK